VSSAAAARRLLLREAADVKQESDDGDHRAGRAATGNINGQTTIFITGGTGRFAGASGVETGSFSAPPGASNGTTMTSALTNSITGAISY
jgi:hypothetical protein